MVDLPPRELLRELKAAGGNLKALRLALTGTTTGPELSAILAALPREEALRRSGRAQAGRAASDPGSAASSSPSTRRSRRLAQTAGRSRSDALERAAPSPPAGRWHGIAKMRLDAPLLDPVRAGWRSCRPRPGRSACTSAGRLSTSGSTSGTRVPFVISMWLRRWLRERGYEVTLVENITDINDKIYEAAPGASAALAADASRWYIEDTSLLGLGRPDVEPTATESVPAIVDAIAELVSRGFAYEVEGDVYFRVARTRRTGSCRASVPIRSRSRSRTRARRIRATLLCGRRRSPARTRPGSRRGGRVGRAGTSSAP